MSETTHTTTHDNHDANAPKIYAAVLGALLILTFITVGASKIQFGSGMINVVIALSIATVKASLVALFFMHLIHDKAMNSIILVASFTFLAVFIGFCYGDQSTRDDLKPLGLKVKAPVVAGAPGAAPGAPAAAAAPAEGHHN
ncbi:MAG: cytochrome C oxidase subunit IV family protein [Bryobacteraceae bacterium]